MGVMRKLKWVGIFMAFCLAQLVCAQPVEAIAPAAKKVLLSRFPKAEIGSVSEGALDGVDNSYMAALLWSYDNGTARVVVLRKELGNWQVVSMSQAWQTGSQPVWSVKIKSDRIELSVYASGGCCSPHMGTYAFRKYKDEFRLVGVESLDFSMADDESGGKSYEIGKSVDLLTHKIVDWVAFGKSIEVGHNNELKLSGRSSYEERRSTFAGNSHWDIENFDKYMDYAKVTPGLCGFYEKPRHFHASCN